MRALVLGGSVFIGRQLVDSLLLRGHQVTVLNRGLTPHDLPDDVERLVSDRRDLDRMRQLLGEREWDAVFDVSGHVLAAGRVDPERHLDLFADRVGHYVYVSSIMAYDQSLVGIAPWFEDYPTDRNGLDTYGGFKATFEAALLARHERRQFPMTIVRPAAVYGPRNNIHDMETPMFLRLLQGRPVLVPHGGLVVGSYGHVDDLCEAMVVMADHPAAKGHVFNVTGDSLEVNRYVRTLAAVVGRDADVVAVPDELLPEVTVAGAPPVFGHLFKVRHHAIIENDKITSLLGWRPRYDVVSGHRHTYEWFQAQGWAELDTTLADPVWKASWDFAAEAALVERIRRG